MFIHFLLFSKLSKSQQKKEKINRKVSFTNWRLLLQVHAPQHVYLCVCVLQVLPAISLSLVSLVTSVIESTETQISRLGMRIITHYVPVQPASCSDRSQHSTMPPSSHLGLTTFTGTSSGASAQSPLPSCHCFRKRLFQKRLRLNTGWECHEVAQRILYHGSHFEAPRPTRALKYGSAVLLQCFGEKPKLSPVAFFSKMLSPAKRNYNTGNWKLVAFKLALEEWCHWLEGTLQHSVMSTFSHSHVL